MPLIPKTIMEAKHVYPGVKTLGGYRQWHAVQIAKLAKQFSNMEFGKPHVWAGVNPAIFIAGGVARVECATEDCANAPAVWLPEGVACCIDCGAIYEDLPLPAGWAEIEALLVQRRDLAARYWNPSRSLDLLREENASGTLRMVE